MSCNSFTSTDVLGLNLIPWLMKGKNQFSIVLKSKWMCLEGPLAKKKKKKAALSFTKSYHIWVPGGSVFCPSLGMLSLEPSTDLSVRRCSGPVRESATSVRKLLQMVQLISWQNSEQTSSKSMGTSLGLNVKLASCSVPLPFLQNKILNRFYWTLDTLECNQSATLFYTICKCEKFKLIVVATLQVHPNSISSIALSIF